MERELTVEIATEILLRCVVVAQSKGAFSIKDAAFLYKVTIDLKKEEGRKKENYNSIIRAIVLANGKGCYSLEDAALVEKIVSFLQKEDLVTTEDSTK